MKELVTKIPANCPAQFFLNSPTCPALTLLSKLRAIMRLRGIMSQFKLWIHSLLV